MIAIQPGNTLVQEKGGPLEDALWFLLADDFCGPVWDVLWDYLDTHVHHRNRHQSR